MGPSGDHSSGAASGPEGTELCAMKAGARGLHSCLPCAASWPHWAEAEASLWDLNPGLAGHGGGRGPRNSWGQGRHEEGHPYSARLSYLGCWGELLTSAAACLPASWAHPQNLPPPPPHPLSPPLTSAPALLTLPPPPPSSLPPVVDVNSPPFSGADGAGAHLGRLLLPSGAHVLDCLLPSLLGLQPGNPGSCPAQSGCCRERPWVSIRSLSPLGKLRAFQAGEPALPRPWLWSQAWAETGAPSCNPALAASRATPPSWGGPRRRPWRKEEMQIGLGGWERHRCASLCAAWTRRTARWGPHRLRWPQGCPGWGRWTGTISMVSL
ncbi:uncharacterized protein LOC113223551 [Piliocolobus tephrosceles]|uniref:uncharacterized protein LOC113223551 n=1 Tax=Piliocolobus tephrosceles TaxID=591936 RepID=UPI000E6B44C7|nr:uncharacterized protein LOC113223551 [Piliocolobus tephrosceles]XP_026308753.1 uncharacterized protein LOC113223551 [Piliocolobus tephrosceles]